MSNLTTVNWPVVKKTGFWVLTVAGYLSLIVLIIELFSLGITSDLVDPVTGNACREGANVVNITLNGPFYTYRIDDTVQASSREIIDLIKKANDDTNIKAIILEVDSPGGDPTAGEELAASLSKSSIPTYVLVRGMAASAAYWGISSGGVIYAYETSEIGSIGVTASYVDNVQKNKAEGLNFNQLSTGKFKDILDPNKPLTQEEKDYITTQINELNNVFIEQVAANRHLEKPLVTQLADGSTWFGAEAKKKGLIDEVGDYNTLMARVEKDLGKKLVTCW